MTKLVNTSPKWETGARPTNIAHWSITSPLNLRRSDAKRTWLTERAAGKYLKSDSKSGGGNIALIRVWPRAASETPRPVLTTAGNPKGSSCCPASPLRQDPGPSTAEETAPPTLNEAQHAQSEPAEAQSIHPYALGRRAALLDDT